MGGNRPNLPEKINSSEYFFYYFKYGYYENTPCIDVQITEANTNKFKKKREPDYKDTEVSHR